MHKHYSLQFESEVQLGLERADVEGSAPKQAWFPRAEFSNLRYTSAQGIIVIKAGWVFRASCAGLPLTTKNHDSIIGSCRKPYV